MLDDPIFKLCLLPFIEIVYFHTRFFLSLSLSLPFFSVEIAQVFGCFVESENWLGGIYHPLNQLGGYELNYVIIYKMGLDMCGIWESFGVLNLLLYAFNIASIVIMSIFQRQMIYGNDWPIVERRAVFFFCFLTYVWDHVYHGISH